MANRNPFLVVVLGDFNVKSENWYKHDKTSYEGAQIIRLSHNSDYSKLLKSLLIF